MSKGFSINLVGQHGIKQTQHHASDKFLVMVSVHDTLGTRSVLTVFPTLALDWNAFMQCARN